MYLNATTVYAIRIVCYLAEVDRKVTAKELADNMRIPSAYLPKVTRVLVQHGMMQSIRGIKGGFVLGKAPSDISLGDIVKIFEEGKREPMPLDTEKNLARQIMLVTKKVEEEYDAVSIASLAATPA